MKNALSWGSSIVAGVVVYSLFFWADSPLDLRWLTWGGSALVVAVFGWVLVRLVLAQKELVRGASLYSQGRFFEALAHFDRARSKAPKQAGVHFNRGLALLCLWRVPEADVAFAETAAAMGKLGQPDLSSMLSPIRAVGAALSGRLEATRSHLSDAERLGSGKDPHATLARMILAVQAADWSGAEAFATQPELNQLGGIARGVSDALMAWIAAQGGSPVGRLNLVAVLGEAGVDQVRAVWPELAGFLSQASGQTATVR